MATPLSLHGAGLTRGPGLRGWQVAFSGVCLSLSSTRARACLPSHTEWRHTVFHTRSERIELDEHGLVIRRGIDTTVQHLRYRSFGVQQAPTARSPLCEMVGGGARRGFQKG